MGNFGGPFTINLVGEITLIVRALGTRLTLRFMVAGLSFFSAAYRLILYAATQQGGVITSTPSYKPFRRREGVIIFSHVWPLAILALSPLIV